MASENEATIVLDVCVNVIHLQKSHPVQWKKKLRTRFSSNPKFGNEYKKTITNQDSNNKRK